MGFVWKASVSKFVRDGQSIIASTHPSSSTHPIHHMPTTTTADVPVAILIQAIQKLSAIPFHNRPKSLGGLANAVGAGHSAFAVVDPSTACRLVPVVPSSLVSTGHRAVVAPKVRRAAGEQTGGGARGNSAGGTHTRVQEVDFWEDDALLTNFVTPHCVEVRMDGASGPFTWIEFRSFYPTLRTAIKKWGPMQAAVAAHAVAAAAAAAAANPAYADAFPAILQHHDGAGGGRTSTGEAGANLAGNESAAQHELELRIDASDGAAYPYASFVQVYGAVDAPGRWDGSTFTTAAEAAFVAAAGTAAAAAAAASASKAAATTSRSLTCDDFQASSHSGQARKVIDAAVINRCGSAAAGGKANLCMRNAELEDVVKAGDRIATYLSKVDAKPTPPAANEVAAHVWLLSLCRSTANAQDVAAAIVANGAASIVDSAGGSNTIAAEGTAEGGGKRKGKRQPQQQVVYPSDHELEAVLQQLQSNLPRTLYDSIHRQPNCACCAWRLPPKQQQQPVAAASSRWAGGGDSFDGWSSTRHSWGHRWRHDYSDLEQAAESAIARRMKAKTKASKLGPASHKLIPKELDGAQKATWRANRTMLSDVDSTLVWQGQSKQQTWLKNNVPGWSSVYKGGEVMNANMQLQNWRSKRNAHIAEHGRKTPRKIGGFELEMVSG